MVMNVSNIHHHPQVTDANALLFSADYRGLKIIHK